jgi:hypothetical protein
MHETGSKLAGAVAAAEWHQGARMPPGVIAGGVPLWKMPEEQQRVVLDTDLGGVLALALEGSHWEQVRHCVAQGLTGHSFP